MKLVCNFIVLAVLLLVCQPASAEKRVALVIGNSTYRSVPALPNPANDAAALAATLRGAGFDIVDSKLDLPIAGMRRALRDFTDLARDSDVAVVYYAGHGIEMQGTNYLIPTDAKLERDADAPDELLSLDRVLAAVEPAKALRLVIVDACRNNPFVDTIQRQVSTRSVSRGLGRVEPTTSNTLVAFAAKAGSTVLDGPTGNSPYATALVKYIARPGLDVRRAFGFVRDDVMEATGSRQEPYVYGSLGGAEVALVPAKVVAPAPADASPTSDLRRDLELAMQIDTKEALDAFLVQHPDGYYASLARLELAQVVGRTRAGPNEKAAPTEPARAQAAEPEQRQVPIHTFAESSPTEHIVSGAATVKDEPSATPERKQEPQQEPPLASLNNAAPQADPKVDLTESVQSELRRVGCLAADGGSPEKTLQHSLALFNKHARTHLDAARATADALEAIKLRPAGICPLVCERGSKVDGDKCSKIVCAEGSFLNSDNECEKRRSKTSKVKRADNPRPKREARDPKATEITLPQGLGKIVCNSSECRSTKNGWTYRFQNAPQ